MQTIKVRALSMAECPPAPATIQLLEDVAGAMDISIALESILVEPPEQAQALASLGSPTVQVPGGGIEPESSDREDFGLI